jgi:signal transduction histidine kinase
MRPFLDVITSLMWVPLVIRDRVVGLLSLTSSRFDAFSVRDANLALAIARQAAVAIDNARLHARARQAAVLEERQRLARELHNSVTDSLISISEMTKTAEGALEAADPEPVDLALGGIAATTQQALSNMRLLLFELRPPLLEQQGLAAALRSRLQAVESRSGLKADLECVGEGRLSAETEHELFRLTQEALNNVLKHAHARAVQVRVELASDYATLEISDDGDGFEPSLATGGPGLQRMREVATRLGGLLWVETSVGSGTLVRATVLR